MEETKPVGTPEAPTQEKKESVWDLIRFTIITLAIVVPIRAYIAQPFIVSGDSMFPTFEDGQYLIIDELSYHLRQPARGEVVIFKYPKDPSKYFIKRVIGLPGETVNIARGRVTVTTTDEQVIVLDEPYTSSAGYETLNQTLEAGEYFVMGDHRPLSLDSRSWGPVSEAEIKGRVLVRLLPMTKASVLPGDYSGDQEMTN